MTVKNRLPTTRGFGSPNPRAGQFGALKGLAAVRPGDQALAKEVAKTVRYDEYLANGWPIGSGIIEGRIQHVVKGRLDTANAVVAKRCEIANRAIFADQPLRAHAA